MTLLLSFPSLNSVHLRPPCTPRVHAVSKQLLLPLTLNQGDIMRGKTRVRKQLNLTQTQPATSPLRKLSPHFSSRLHPQGAPHMCEGVTNNTQQHPRITLELLLLCILTVAFIQECGLSPAASPARLPLLKQTLWIRRCDSIGCD